MWCNELTPPVVLQAGGDLFPLDSAGELIPDNTNFLETWEVSQNSLNIRVCVCCLVIGSHAHSAKLCYVMTASVQ